MYLFNKKNINAVLSVFLGLIFLLSGLAKALNISSFGDILTEYHSKLYNVAPIIVALEIYLGISFLLLRYQKSTSLLSLIFVLFLTIFFLLGYFLLHITDCGCFGRLLKISPKLSVARNLLMMLISGYLWKQTWQENNRNTIQRFIPILLALVSFIFLSVKLYQTYIPIKYIQGSSISTTFLSKHTHVASQEQYIFLFKPSCGHCWKETKNINEIIGKKPDIDIIGLYPSNSTAVDMARYKQKGNNIFKIYPENNDSIKCITHTFPKILLLKQGKIVWAKRNME